MRVAAATLGAGAAISTPPALAQTAAAEAGDQAISVEARLMSGTRQLTFEGRRAGEGYFSADGRRMIFQSERVEGNPFYQIFVLDMETGDVSQVSPGHGKTTCGWLHPFENKAMFASTQDDPQARAKQQAELDFRASGQSRRYSWDYDPFYDIVVADLDGGGFVNVTNTLGYDAEGAYSPDGSQIVFASNRAAYAETLTEAEQARLERDPAFFMDLYIMDADGANVRRLTNAPGYDGGPFFSADGEKITWRRFSENGARAEIFTMRVDGTEERQVTELGAMSWAPFFHPSGDYIVFATNRQGFGNFELYLVDAEGRRAPVRATETDGFDGLASFSPDGGRITWTSNRTADGNSQIFLADWNDAEARALLGLDQDGRLIEEVKAPPPPDTADDIRVADLRAHLETLADESMGGRLTGTEGERLATQYVADVFAALGLEPAGENGTYFQEFELTTGVTLGQGNTLSLEIGDAARAPALDTEWRPLSFAEQGEVAPTRVVFAGYGISSAGDGGTEGLYSYEGLDVEDAWVLVLRGLPADLDRTRRIGLNRYADLRFKASTAKGFGAKGIIVAPPPAGGFREDLPELRYIGSTAGAGLPALAVDAATRDALLARLEGAEDLIARLDAGETGGGVLDGVRASADLALEFTTSIGRNVLAKLDTPAPDDAPMLAVGGHVDHLGRGRSGGSLARADEQGELHLGADDNASGVSATLEIAERLVADLRDGRLDAKRDVLFAAWSGEELGLLGVFHYLRGLQAETGSDDLSPLFAAYINLDMVGRFDGAVEFSGLASSSVWRRELERRNAPIGLPLTTVDDPYLPTDATAFYVSGVPTLSAFTGAHADYHSPRDTVDKIDFPNLQRIARLTHLIAKSRIEAEEAPEYVKIERQRGAGQRRMANVYLGTIPAYATEGRVGVPLSGVMSGGPAEAAGVQGGDSVVGLAGFEIANIYDLVRILNGLKAGETVPIQVERDGERVELEVTPAARE